MHQLPANFKGSISEGTLHPRHLVPTYVRTLAFAWPDHSLVKHYNELGNALATLGDFLSEEPAHIAEQLDFWHSPAITGLMNDLFDALNEVAPEGTSFGSSEGDGASMGFWDLDEEDMLLHIEADVTFNPAGGPYFND